MGQPDGYERQGRVLHRAGGVAPHDRQSGGKIINIGSIGGETGMPSSAVYCATKGAIKLLTKSLRPRSPPAQHPGEQPVAGLRGVRHECRYRVEIEGFTESLQGRFGEGDPWMVPDDMAGTAVFLASADFRHGYRANIMVDRGYSAF